jgi:hypothetical protein
MLQIDNKTLSIESYISFDLIWYLYQFYKQNKVKKEKLFFNIVLSENGVEINCNGINVNYNYKNFIHNNFVTTLSNNLNILLSNNNIDKKNSNTFTKDYVVNNFGKLHKNISKCFGDTIVLSSQTMYDVLSYSDNCIKIWAIIAKEDIET